jgi:hypothetical protein
VSDVAAGGAGEALEGADVDGVAVALAALPSVARLCYDLPAVSGRCAGPEAFFKGV